MSTVAILTWPGGGNLPPAVGLAQILRSRGHRVVFAGYAFQADQLSQVGFEVSFLAGASQGWERFDPARLMEFLTDRVWACPDHVADVSGLVQDVRPDLVVVDCLMGAALAALEACETPALSLVHSAPGALCPPGGFMDATVLPSLNHVRAGLGLAPVDSHWAAWQPHRVLCTSIPELDPLASQVPPAFTWVGPIFDTDGLAQGAEFGGTAASRPATERPLVLVSFSTGTAWDQTSRIQKTLDGLAGAEVDVLVTTGAVDPAQLSVPDNVTVERFVPHQLVLDRVSAVVTHAGHGTVSAALSHGRPLVTMPNLAADQPALAARVAELGAGISLDADSARPDDVRDAVRAVLEEQSYREAATRLKGRIDHARTAARFDLGLA